MKPEQPKPSQAGPLPAPGPDDPRSRLLASQIARLSAQRVRRNDGAPLPELIPQLRRSIARTARAIGPAAEAWMGTCPPGLLGSTTVLGLQRGTLRIGVRGAPQRYALNRWLRGGGELAIAQACPVEVRRITLVPLASDAEAGATGADNRPMPR